MKFNSKSIQRKYLYEKSKNIKNKTHLYRCVILYNSILKNKDATLISDFEELSDVGCFGKYKGIFNKEIDIILLTCRRDLAMIKYLALKTI